MTGSASVAILRGMAVLKNQRHEKFAQLVAGGERVSRAVVISNNRTGDASDADRVLAAKWVANGNIAARIAELKEASAAKAEWGVADALMDFLKVATADPRELIETRIGACRFCYGENHQFHWKEREYLEAVQRAEAAEEPLPDPAGGFGYRRTAMPHPDCPECEGEGAQRIVPKDTAKLSPQALMIYEGVKKTKDGYEIKIADRHKARENAARIIGAFVDRKEVSGPGGAPVPLDLSGLSEEQLRALASIAING